jgi:hypothetical protein
MPWSRSAARASRRNSVEAPRAVRGPEPSAVGLHAVVPDGGHPALDRHPQEDPAKRTPRKGVEPARAGVNVKTIPQVPPVPCQPDPIGWVDPPRRHPSSRPEVDGIRRPGKKRRGRRERHAAPVRGPDPLARNRSATEVAHVDERVGGDCRIIRCGGIIRPSCAFSKETMRVGGLTILNARRDQR